MRLTSRASLHYPLTDGQVHSGFSFPTWSLNSKNKADQTEEYFIIDAKYSTLKTVKTHYAIPIVFKYQLCIRSAIATANVASLVALYGKRSEGAPEEISFGDYLPEEGTHAEPSFTAKQLFPE